MNIRARGRCDGSRAWGHGLSPFPAAQVLSRSPLQILSLPLGTTKTFKPRLLFWPRPPCDADHSGGRDSSSAETGHLHLQYKPTFLPVVNSALCSSWSALSDHCRTLPTFRFPMEWKYSTHRPLGIEEAVKKLRQDETSTVELVDGTNNIRTDTVRVASVTRVEDDLSWGRLTVGNDDKWRYWGVYDGHVWVISHISSFFLAQELTYSNPGAGQRHRFFETILRIM